MARKMGLESKIGEMRERQGEKAREGEARKMRVQERGG